MGLLEDIKASAGTGSVPVATKPQAAPSGLLGEIKASAKQDQIFSGGGLQDLFDVLQIPQFAATGALTPGITIDQAIQQRVAPSKAMKIDNPWAAFAVDVIADPLNFLGIGAVTKAGVSAAKGGKAAVTLGKAAQKGEKALVTLDVPFVKALQGIPIVKGTPVFENLTKLGNKLDQVPGIKQFRSAFTKTGPLRKLGSVEEIEKVKKGMIKVFQEADEAKALMRAVQSDTLEFARVLDKGLKSLVSAGEATKDDVVQFARKLNDPDMAAEIPQAMVPLFNKAKAKTDQLGIIWSSSGGRQLSGKVLPNVPSKGSREYLKELASKPVSSAVFSGKTGSDISPKYFKLGDDIVVKEGRKAFSLETGKEFVGKQGGSFVDDLGRSFEPSNVRPDEINPVFEKLGIKLRFAEDAPVQLATLGGVAGKKQASARFIDGVKKFGMKIDGKLPPGMVASKVVDGYAFPEEMIQIIDQTFRKFSEIKSVSNFIKGYDKLLNLWKGSATFVIPAFHTRNMVSNMWQMFLAGTDFRHMGKALKLQKAAGKARKTGEDISKFLKGDDLKLFKEFREQGLGGVGWFSSDVEKSLRGLQNNFVYQVGGDTGAFLEDWSKLGLFLDRKAKGFPVHSAAADVKKFLFDYTDLTDFEKNVMKRIMPFYTWTRKNLPLQAAMLIQAPSKLSIIDKARKAIESQAEGTRLEDKYMPKWLRNGYTIFLGEDDNAMQNFFNTSGFLPTIDLETIFNPGDEAGGISPLIKTPIELLTNYDWYFQDQITDFPGQKREFLGADLPPGLIKVLKSIRPISETERLRKAAKDDELPEAVAKLLFGGKVTEVDPESEKYWFGVEQGKVIKQITKDMEKAEKRGDTEEALRLKTLLEEARTGEY